MDIIMDDNARTLFDIGFSRARVGATGLAQGEEARDGHSDGPTATGTHDDGVVGAATLATPILGGASTTTRGASLAKEAPPKSGSSFLIPAASAKIYNVEMGEHIWRLFRQNLDIIIKANTAAKVIPCAQTIAEEVIRQQQLQQLLGL